MKGKKGEYKYSDNSPTGKQGQSSNKSDDSREK